VGLFSFLTGHKDEEKALAEIATAVGREPAANEQLENIEPVQHTTPAPEALFTPPEAWNIDALTAPAPETSGADKPTIGAADPAITAELQGPVIEATKTVYDPEIPVDIYELGLIYDITADADRNVLVKMTLTSPACPSAQQLPSEVRYKVKAVPGVKDAWVDIVWEPPWSKERMSEAAKLALGIY
jgi:FeS assembly SUF system protein